MIDWSTTLTSDLIAEVARIACGPNPELLATSKAAKELDRRLPKLPLKMDAEIPERWEGTDEQIVADAQRRYAGLMPELSEAKASIICPYCKNSPILIGLKTCGRLVCTDAESVAQKVYLREGETSEDIVARTANYVIQGQEPALPTAEDRAEAHRRLLKTPTPPSSLLKLLKLRIEMVAEGKQHPSALRPALGWLEEAMSDVEKLEREAAPLSAFVYCKAKGLQPGYLFSEEGVAGLSVFSRISNTGKLICHPRGEPDMQSSWAWTPEQFEEHARNVRAPGSESDG